MSILKSVFHFIWEVIFPVGTFQLDSCTCIGIYILVNIYYQTKSGYVPNTTVHPCTVTLNQSHGPYRVKVTDYSILHAPLLYIQ